MAIKTNIIDTLEIGTDSRPVGAEADNVAIQRDTSGNIIATEKASGATQESAAYTLKTVEEDINDLENQLVEVVGDLSDVVDDLGGIKFGIDPNTGKYGYYEGETFKSFRQPTGDAVASDVLVGKTFANGSSDAEPGNMPDYTSNYRTVTPTGGTGLETLSLNGTGKHSNVIVDRTAPYNAGIENQKNENWSYTLSTATMQAILTGLRDITNVSEIKIVSHTPGFPPMPSTIRFYNTSFAQVGNTITITGTITDYVIPIPSGAKYIIIGYDDTTSMVVKFTHYCQKFR